MVLSDISIRQTLPKYLQRYFLQLKPGEEPTVNSFNEYLSCNAVQSELGDGYEGVAQWCSNPKNLSDATLSRLLACTQNNLQRLESDLMSNLPLEEKKAYWLDDGTAVVYKTEMLYVDPFGERKQEFSLEDPNADRGQVAVSKEELERVNKETGPKYGIRINLSEDGKKLLVHAISRCAQLEQLPLNIVINGKRANGDDTKILLQIKDVGRYPEEPGTIKKAGPWIAGIGGGVLSLFSLFFNKENKLNSILGIVGGALIALAYPIYSMLNRKYSDLQPEQSKVQADSQN